MDKPSSRLETIQVRYKRYYDHRVRQVKSYLNTDHHVYLNGEVSASKENGQRGSRTLHTLSQRRPYHRNYMRQGLWVSQQQSSNERLYTPTGNVVQEIYTVQRASAQAIADKKLEVAHGSSALYSHTACGKTVPTILRSN